MTARSEHGRYVRGMPAAIIAADGPADVGALRDGLINNTNHLLDVSTQPLVSLVGEWDTFNDGDASEWHRPYNMPAPVFPLRFFPNGESARVVVRIRVASASAGTATFRVALRGFGAHVALPPVGGTVTDAEEISTTSTTGEDIGVGPLYLERATGQRNGWPSLNGAGNAAYVNFVRFARLDVWALGASALIPAEVFGLYAREYIG